MRGNPSVGTTGLTDENKRGIRTNTDRHTGYPQPRPEKDCLAWSVWPENHWPLRRWRALSGWSARWPPTWADRHANGGVELERSGYRRLRSLEGPLRLFAAGRRHQSRQDRRRSPRRPAARRAVVPP